jgi:hypothetical protein
MQISGRYISVCIFSILFITVATCSNNIPIDNSLCRPISKQSDQIQSIKIYETSNSISDAIIELGSDETITLEFDDLSNNTTSYYYTIVYCTSNWKESGLLKPEYLDGFDSNPINDYQNSTATTVPYTHYRLIIPNSNIKLKLSGNYLVRIFDVNDLEKICLEQKFMVVERLVDIKANVKQPNDQLIRLSSQQLELSINTSRLNIADPSNELIPIIIQNNQFINGLSSIKPTFIKPDEIIYSSLDKLIFDGVNEYRWFDINSIRFISSGIQSIEQFGGEFNVQLLPSQNNRNQKYTSQADINGKYQVKLERSELSDIEADYTWLYFTLPYFDQLPDKEVYVFGELTGWNLGKENLMNYNFQRQAYELRLKLKQGYYNYRYTVRDTKSGAIDFTYFEGNHFETENSYQILVYYKQIGARYERLVGVRKINSRGVN